MTEDMKRRDKNAKIREKMMRNGEGSRIRQSYKAASSMNKKKKRRRREKLTGLQV